MISDIEKTAFAEFEKVGDEGLFPNHTDKDIWISGFKSGSEWRALNQKNNKPKGRRGMSDKEL